MSDSVPGATVALDRLSPHLAGVLDLQVQLLRELVGCETVSTPKPEPHFRKEVARALDRVESFLTEAGCAVQRWDARDGFPTLRAERRTGGIRPTIGFNGHIDVVPIEDLRRWSSSPWGGERIGDRIYGRGTCDAKGSVVALLGALDLLRRAGLEPSVNLLLHIVSDEEVAGPCTDEQLARGYPDAVIVGEPSSLDVWIAEPGLEHLRIEVLGIATHALNRWRSLPDVPGSESGGVNAIDKAFIVADALRDLEREWTSDKRYPLLPPGFNTINLGAMIGGKSGAAGTINAEAGPGSVPDRCALEYNIWYYPGESLESIKAELEARVLARCEHDWWLRDHPPLFIWALRGLTNPPAETEAGHPLAAALLDASRQLEPDAQATAMQGASLLPWYTRRGIPGVIFGPGNVGQAHGVDEFIDVNSLRDTTLALTRALVDARLKEVPGRSR